MYSPTQYTPSPRSTRHRSQNYTWDHSYFYTSETTLSPTSSVIAPYHPPPSPTPSPPQPPAQPLTTLPSRISALNRRAAIVSTNLAHLTAVVKPLETTTLEALSDDLLNDMWEEGQGLGKAMEAFKDQMEEVSGLLEELVVSKKKRKGRKAGGGRGREMGRSKGGELEF